MSIPLRFLIPALAALSASPALAASNPAWTQPQAPFHIAGDIYYVGSRGLAAYLIASPEGHVLIDGTLAENAAMVEANIKALGFRLKDVKILLANHAHHDHAGALAQLKKDTGARLLASPGDRWALEHGRSRGDNTNDLPPWPPVKVDGLLTDGEVIRLGPIALTTVFTPGHTPGCTSWTLPVVEGGVKRQALFLCSITVAGNVLVGNKAYPAIAADYRRTLARLEPLNPSEIVLPGHPEVTDVLGRHEAQRLGDPDPWSDSGQLVYLLDAAAAELDAALGKPHPPNVPSAPAAGRTGWRTVIQPDERFALPFPAAPTVVPERYDLGSGAGAPARTYSARQGKTVYRLAVADVAGRDLDREAVFRTILGRLLRGARVRTYAEARIRLFHGRQVSAEWPDGGRSVASVFIAGPRLYALEARAAGPDGRAATADLIRFQQMLNLY